MLLQTFMSLGREGSETASVAASTGTTVAFRLSTGDGWVDLASFDARTGRGLRRAEHVAPPGAVAVTADGVVAWTAGDALLATGPDDEARELDRGAIADLRADGALLRWSRDGAPRSADPP